MKLSEITPKYLVDNYILGAQLVNAIKANDLLIYESEIKKDVDRLIKAQTTSFLQTHILAASDDLEKKLGVYLSTKRVATHPEYDGLVEGDDYDVRGTPMTYYQSDWIRFNQLVTPYNHITKVNSLRMFHGEMLVGSVPDSWIVLTSAKQGILNIVPYSGGLFLQGATALGSGVLYYLTRDQIPGFWSLNCECGLVELPESLAHLICISAARGVLAILSNTLSGGVASQSISFDGFSASNSTTASAIYSLYSALENSYKEMMTKEAKHHRAAVRGIKVFRI